MPRTKKIKVHTVNLDLDETPTHWLVFVSPLLAAQALGISYHRARLPRCLCERYGGKAARCRWCKGWSVDGMSRYVARLLRSYPKQTVEITVLTARERERQSLARAKALVA